MQKTEKTDLVQFLAPICLLLAPCVSTAVNCLGQLVGRLGGITHTEIATHGLT